MTLAGKRILVTGGSGFIGSHIVDLLLSDEVAEVVALDNMIRGRPANLAEAAASGRLRIVEGDVCDRPLIEQLVGEADLVFHMAALRITHCAANPRLAFEVMARATFDLLELCVARRVKKVIAASSASIYGLADRFPTDETAPPYDNRTLYGAFKSMNEGILRAFNEMYGLPYCAIRFFNVYGPRMDIHGKYTEVLIRWMDRIAAGLPPVIFGDGLQTMDFVHVRDCARACVLAARAEVSDEVFNVARGEEVSLCELAHALLAVMGRPDLRVEFGPERSVSPVSRRLADVTKAERLLGFRADIDLKEGLSELVGWWRRERTVGREQGEAVSVTSVLEHSAGSAS
jgi:UDP-glucose 4-epimerase